MSFVESTVVDRRRSLDLMPAGMLLVWLYVALVGGTSAVLTSFSIRLISILFLVGAIGFWLLRAILSNRAITTTTLERPIAVLLLAATASAILSIAPRISAETVFLYGAYAILFVLLVALAHSHGADLFKTLIAATVAVAIATLVEPLLWYFGLAPGLGYEIAWPSVALDGQILPPIWPRPGFVTGNPNILAGFLAPWLAVALQMALANRSSRGLASVWFSLLGLALLTTLSRGGFLAAFAGIAFVFLATYSLRHHALFARCLRASRLGVAFGAVALGIVLLVLRQALPSGGVAAGSAGVRVELWTYALQMVQQRPLFGMGPDSFGLALLQSRSPSGRPEDFLPHPHNLYLGLAAETGIIGLLATIWLAYSICRIWWRTRPTSAEESQLGRWMAPMAGLIVMAVHGMVEDFRIYPLIVVQAMVFAALIVARVPRETTKQYVLKARWLAFPVLLLLLPTLYTSFTRWEADRASRSVASAQWTSAQASIASAAYFDPAISFYRAQSALVRGSLALAGNGEDLAASIADYRRAIAAEPFHALNYANLAALLWQDEQREEAIDMMQRATHLQPSRIDFSFALAVYLDDAGHRDTADQQFIAILRDNPFVIQSHAWSSFVPTDRQADILSASPSEPDAGSLSRGRMAMAMENWESAEAIFRQQIALYPDDFDGWWNLGLALQQVGRIGESEQALRKAVGMSPLNVDARADLAAVLLERDGRQEARQQAGISIFEHSNGRAHLVLARLARQEGKDDVARHHYESALPRTMFDLSYAVTAWRRPGLPIDRVPQLPALVANPEEENVFKEYANYLASTGDIESADRVLSRWMAYDRWAEGDVRLAREHIVAKTNGHDG